MIDRRKTVVLVPLLTILGIWVTGLAVAGAFSGRPGYRDFGEDFDVYHGAAQVLKTGDDVYDAPLLFATEGRLLHEEGLKVYEPRLLVRVGSPPLFVWLLQPLTSVPLRAAVLFWDLLMLALSAIGFIAALRSQGWRRLVFPLLILLAMPPTLEGVLYGEVTAL
jgi:hypothetical protein